jgi:hypothetical protein
MLMTVGGILLLLILLLAIPVNLVYAVKKETSWAGRIIVYWMFGKVRFHLRPGRKREPPQSQRRRSRLRRASRVGKRVVRRRRYIFNALRTPGLIRRIIKLKRDLSGVLRPRRLRVQFIIGMDDPADTGRLWGLLAPLRLLFGTRSFGKSSAVSVEVTPDFIGPRFTGYSCASVQFVPLQLIGLFIGFGLSAPFLGRQRSISSVHCASWICAVPGCATICLGGRADQ